MVRVLISGAGIAGPTLAYWLAHYGFTPTLIEAAPQLRTGGYVIDFWGLGYTIAERMGLLPEIQRCGYRVREVRVVDRRGRRAAGFPAESFSRLAGGHYVSLSRGDLAAAIFHALAGRVETIFGDTVENIEESPETVRVAFAHSPAREFDLVIGADGLHSGVRRLRFGPDERYERYLGIKVAAFETRGYRPRDELVYIMYSEVGRQAARFAMRDDRTLFLLTFLDGEPAIPRLPADQKTFLHERFAGAGWECPRILDVLDEAEEVYFDRISQIRMDGWTRGRVALLGDAAFCVSLLAGQGSSLAMAAAYILAGELHRAHGDYAAAFARYQDRFAPFVAAKQRNALRLGNTFAPPSHLSLFLRNRVMNLLSFPWVADWVAGRGLADRLDLPDY
jgi:2-polyprenyl-6-methoxyphenol hydroxylase-like FAD-dependent oxidoreductase